MVSGLWIRCISWTANRWLRADQVVAIEFEEMHPGAGEPTTYFVNVAVKDMQGADASVPVAQLPTAEAAEEFVPALAALLASHRDDAGFVDIGRDGSVTFTPADKVVGSSA